VTLQEDAQRTILATQGRIIDSVCICCEGFELEPGTTDQGVHGERLSGLFVHHATTSLDEAIDAAEAMGRGMGAPLADVMRLRQISSEKRGATLFVDQYQWRAGSLRSRSAVTVDVQLEAVDQTWLLYLAVNKAE
jgi:hypothetical protein